MSRLQPEPWLRATHNQISAVPRAVIHAIELAREDLATWCGDLTEQELCAKPFNLPSLVFQLRHIARSLDRLLSYAEGSRLNPQQLDALNSESHVPCPSSGVFRELHEALAQSLVRIRHLSESSADLEQPRFVGRKNLPTTVAGVLVHVADHTQRHVGQAVTTAKILLAQRGTTT